MSVSRAWVNSKLQGGGEAYDPKWVGLLYWALEADDALRGFGEDDPLIRLGVCSICSADEDDVDARHADSCPWGRIRKSRLAP